MLQIIIFLSGAVLMSLEMVGSRLLAPTFGSTIYVWGSLIVVVMAALTLGYYYGGRIADKYPHYKVMGMILAFGGLYIGFLPFWSQMVTEAFGSLEPRIGSLLVSMAFFFIPSILLATISPFGIKLSSRSLTTIGNTAGYMAAISSGGSILGTLLTSFFLIPVMGVRNIVHMLGLILLILAFVVFIIARRQPAGPQQNGHSSVKRMNMMMFLVLLCIIALVGLWVSYSLRVSDAKVLYERDSLYHHIKVVQFGTSRRLHFDNSFQSEMDLNNPLDMAFIYTSYLHLGVVAHPHPSHVLFIGLGGGSAPRKFLHDYPSIKTADAVDIDPEVVMVARKYFKLPNDPRLRVYTQDGRMFLEKKVREIAAGRSSPYDMVIIDAYNASSIPYHLTTREFVRAVRNVMTPDGVLVSNIIGAFAGPSSPLLCSMARTTASVFPRIYLFPTWEWRGKDDYTESNVILVATADARHWHAASWQNRAESLYRSGAIKENVPEYVKTLVEDTRIRKNSWYVRALLLTDDFAPVDTLKNPL